MIRRIDTSTPSFQTRFCPSNGSGRGVVGLGVEVALALGVDEEAGDAEVAVALGELVLGTVLTSGLPGSAWPPHAATRKVAGTRSNNERDTKSA